jgi:hypothetical protein
MRCGLRLKVRGARVLRTRLSSGFRRDRERGTRRAGSLAAAIDPAQSSWREAKRARCPDVCAGDPCSFYQTAANFRRAWKTPPSR